MLIACPACSTRYVVPDSAIGVEGRSVRCAKCRHNWFQEGTAIGPAGLHEQPEAETRSVPDEIPAGQSAGEAQVEEGDDAGAASPVRETIAANEASPRPAEQNEATLADPPIVAHANLERPDTADHEGNDFSLFDHKPPFRQRRNSLRLWTIAAAIFAILAIGGIAAASFWGMPEWAPLERPIFGVAQPDLVLEFPPDQQDRRTLPNGTEFFGASGTITNVGRETRSIPPILIVLRDERDRIVYRWEIAPPQARLAPGETVSINEAVTDVPRSARIAEIGWKPD